MFFTAIDNLEERINQLKEDLIQIVEATGLNSPETLYCSQKLDQLITTYQKNHKLNDKKEKIIIR